MIADTDVTTFLAPRTGRRPRLRSLSERELEILGLMARGLSNRSICGELSITGKTLESHIGRIFMKLDLPPTSQRHRRVQAVICFLAETGSLGGALAS